MGVPTTEPIAVAAAKAEAGIAERTAFSKSLPTAVLPVMPLSAIVLPAAAVTVAPSVVLGEGA